MITVLIVDDQALVRDGLRAILSLAADIEVVGEACDGNQAVSAAERLKPDVVLMDVRMPGMDGLAAAEVLLARERPPKVIMLTTFDRNEYVYRAIMSGASGFLLKDARREQLFQAVRGAVAGETLIAAATTRRLIEQYCRLPDGSETISLDSLTPREMDVLRLMGRGLSNSEIAAALVISETTVKTHVARILMKFRLRDRAQAVVLAYESGLVKPASDSP